MPFSISVVMATYNRQMALERLLGDLARQRLSPELFEVIVVDDGSVPRVADRIKQTRTPFSLRLLEQANAGPAAARHRGVLAATGEILVFLDDDMQVGPDFLNQHLAEHAALGHVVVLGLIQAPPQSGRMPVFERFHLDSLARQAQQVRAGEVQLRGLNLCTGNVSMRRLDYLAVGGFDVSLRESEDRDLGIRLEQAGIRICMSDTAASIHATDHGDVAVWLNRSRRYGVNDLKIHRKYAQVPDTNPWRFLFMVSPLSVPLLLAAASTTTPTRGASSAVMTAASLVDRVGISSMALRLATLAYGVEYFSGLREESGTLPDAMRGLAEELASMGAARRAEAVTATATFFAAMDGDKAGSLRHRAQYHADQMDTAGTAKALVEQIGLQMMAAIRLMQWFRDAGSPLGARICSRLIRHVYGAEIHWDAHLAPGISIIHGVGLVISHAAVVEEGCILFQNVTLGESLHPDTKERGAPHLEANVHVGPGCTLLGPITVGAGSKLMAGSVLTRSVPPRTLVKPADVHVTARPPAQAPPAKAAPGAKRRGNHLPA